MNFRKDLQHPLLNTNQPKYAAVAISTSSPIFRTEDNTPPKFNIAPKKWWLGEYFPVGKITFHWLC